MSAYFQRGCPGVDPCSLQIQGQGRAQWMRGTLLRRSTRREVSLRWQVQYPSAIAPRTTVALCVHRGSALNDSHPDMPRLRQFALLSAQSGDYDQAIASFNALLALCPNSAADYNNRGLVHFQAGHLDQAIADYNQALELNPCLDSAYNNRANYYAAKGNLLEAILDYDIALELNPDNVRAWINQGITFRDLKMYNRALENFNLALKFSGLEGHIYAERGRTHHLNGDWNWAIADYNRALGLLSNTDRQTTSPLSRIERQVQRWINELQCNLEL